uniref:DnaJ homolog subfamily B member 14-like n=1 Tax=Phallusia mammillata TaxID=59560 RepID=A0A6F9DB07_9ASCI|nr:dnaJ homolog subfamily B member 14-like [Phallusia mammillata]
MESNREEAQKCLRIAQTAYSKGDTDKAQRFLKKSNKLYPLKQAEELLERILNSSSKSSNHSSTRQKKPSGGSQSMPDFSNLHGSSAESTPKYTAEQKGLVDKVNKVKDFYDILGVTKEANDNELKKAYRKMALQLHPDKNSAPGATDAFKAVGKAYAVLSDTEQRRRYDLYGPEEVQVNRRRRRNSSDNEDMEFDPNEFFNMFFGGGYPNENVRVFRQGNTYYYDRRAQHRHQNHETHQGNPVVWIQLLPILLIFIMSLFGNLFVSDPVYSLHRKGEYAYQKHTVNLNVRYFVRKDFEKQYKQGGISLQRLEETIEADYVENLRSGCYQERINKENMRRKGLYFGSQDIVNRAEKMTTPSCEKLEKLFNRPG